MGQARIDKNLLKQLYEDQGTIPEDAAPPELPEHLGFYYEAFFTLCKDRSYGFAPGPIPWSSIERYAEKNYLDEERTEALHHYIGTMDLAWAKWQKDHG